MDEDGRDPAAASIDRWGFPTSRDAPEAAATGPAFPTPSAPPLAALVEDGGDDGESTSAARDLLVADDGVDRTSEASPSEAPPFGRSVVRWFDEDRAMQRGTSAVVAFTLAGLVTIILLIAFQPRLACNVAGMTDGRRVVSTALVVGVAAAALPLTWWWRSVRGDDGDGI